MFPVIRYNDVNYPESVKSALYLVDFMNMLSEREKDLLIVYENIVSARSAAFPNELTTPYDYKALETIMPIIKKHNWHMLLENPTFVKGVSTNGDDFFVVS